MQASYQYKLFQKADDLPEAWDDVAGNDIFLSSAYAKLSDISPALHMECLYVGVFMQNKLVGVVFLQCIHLSALPHYGTRQHCIKAKARQWLMHGLAGRLLFVGNNMLTGQHACAFKPEVPVNSYAEHLQRAAAIAVAFLNKKGYKPQAILYKDFPQLPIYSSIEEGMKNAYVTYGQPNMYIPIAPHWDSEAAYVSDLIKKYRDQWKRARKKASPTSRRELSLYDIEKWEKTLYNQYKYVADHAVFNTFYLEENHFFQLKKQFGPTFKVFGYFMGETLIGFCTYFVNHDILDTYFLGYESEQQKVHLLYLNMLYDMLIDAIALKCRRIVYSRSALEIKSSVGAKPELLQVYIQHRYKWMQKLLPLIYKRLEPTVDWQLRHPFKSAHHDTIHDNGNQLGTLVDHRVD